MTVFNSLLSIMITLFLLLAVGFFCRKVHITDGSASKSFSKLIVTVGQPLLVLSAMNNAEYSEENLRIALWTTLIGFAMHTLLALSAFLICRGMKKNPDRAKIFEFALVFSNCGFIGFPILDSIFENGLGSFMGAFYILSLRIFLWTWGVLIFGRGRDDIHLTPRKALLNLGTVPCAIGFVFYLLKGVPFEIPYAVGRVFTYLGGLCTPVSLLITGGLLATVSLREMFRNKMLYLHCFLSLIVFPVAFCLIAKFLRLPDNFILFCTVMAGLPAASTVSMFSEIYDVDPGYASQTVSMTTLLTTATLPLAVLFAQWVITW